MLIHVHHAEYPGSDLIEHVAVVDAPDHLDTIESLSYAFRWTNNVDGSWSKDKTFRFFGETHDNGDYNERVKCTAKPHPEGYGTRSTSVGDIMCVGSDMFEVMPNGFRQITKAA